MRPRSLRRRSGSESLPHDKLASSSRRAGSPCRPAAKRHRRRRGHLPSRGPCRKPVIALAGAIAGDAMADAVDAAKLLDVDMDELAGLFPLVADDGGLGVERLEAAKPKTAQHLADRRDRPAKPACDRRSGQALAPQRVDLGLGTAIETARRRVWSRRAVLQPGGAFGMETIAPLAHRPSVDTLGRGDGRDGPACFQTSIISIRLRGVVRAFS